MGSAIERLSDPDHEIVARFNSEFPLTRDSFAGRPLPDVAIDFSVPEAIAGHVDTCCHLGIPLVVGTTGWQQEREAIESTVIEANGTLLHAANFSLGIAVVREALRIIQPTLDRLEGFEASLHEVHHVNKVDSPSGTALELAALIDQSARMGMSSNDAGISGRRATDSIPITSERTGTVHGRHTVAFEGPFDSIVIEHSAKSRDGFAAGAIRAAEWLIGRRGVYTFDDVFSSNSPRPSSPPPARTEQISYMHSFGV